MRVCNQKGPIWCLYFVCESRWRTCYFHSQPRTFFPSSKEEDFSWSNENAKISILAQTILEQYCRLQVQSPQCFRERTASWVYDTFDCHIQCFECLFYTNDYCVYQIVLQGGQVRYNLHNLGLFLFPIGSKQKPSDAVFPVLEKNIFWKIVHLSRILPFVKTASTSYARTDPEFSTFSDVHIFRLFLSAMI